MTSILISDSIFIFLHRKGVSVRSASVKIKFFKKYFSVIAIDSRGDRKLINTTTNQVTFVQMCSNIKICSQNLTFDQTI